ncbi:hypothetical protein [Polaribacter sp. R77954]|uniref:hypothetical protein n=1 Tax=Polaribacter sp. R77954 TaxID=3093870 RepID=UPI0037C6B627
MKTIKMKITKIFAILTIISLQACGGSKTTISQNGDKVVSLPCSGYEIEQGDDDSNSIASSSAISTSLSASRDKALFAAKSVLASNIKSTITSFTQRYTNDREIGNQSEFGQKFQNIGKELVNQELNNTRKICEKTLQKPDGRYQTFVAVKINTNKILNGLKESAKLRQDYDEHKFQKYAEEEMKKASKKNN